MDKKEWKEDNVSRDSRRKIFESIAESERFCAVVDPGYIASAERFAEWAYACELGKPFIVILLDDTEVADDYPKPEQMELLRVDTQGVTGDKAIARAVLHVTKMFCGSLGPDVGQVHVTQHDQGIFLKAGRASTELAKGE